MQGVGEIHPLSRAIQCLGSQRRVLQCDPRQTGKGSESSKDPLAAEPISASQHQLGFEQHCRADVHFFVVDQRARLRELVGIVLGQIADDDISCGMKL
jgi:hypothetical protein